MTLVAGIAIADPDLSLRDIAAQLEQMRERTPRGSREWAASSVKSLLDRARSLGLVAPTPKSDDWLTLEVDIAGTQLHGGAEAANPAGSTAIEYLRCRRPSCRFSETFALQQANRSDAMRSKFSLLETVYPPISSQEAVWLQHDSNVKAIMRTSDFYMIGARAEAKFVNSRYDPDEYSITFDFAIGDEFSDLVTIDLAALPYLENGEADRCEVEFGEKIFRIWDGLKQVSPLLVWFTPEKLIWDRSRGLKGINDFQRYREAAIYDLLYVGIAKVGDSFDRLIANGHSARMEILSNEPQRYPNSRVTDEIFLFLFKVDSTVMMSFDTAADFEKEDLMLAIDPKRVVADAEKAFVSLLQPAYNIRIFKNYPRGADGLYRENLDSYVYSMCEVFTFNTAHGRFRGSRDPSSNFITNDGDFISVKQDDVELFVSGIDFSTAYPEDGF